MKVEHANMVREKTTRGKKKKKRVSTAVRRAEERDRRLQARDCAVLLSVESLLSRIRPYFPVLLFSFAFDRSFKGNVISVEADISLLDVRNSSFDSSLPHECWTA